MDDHIVFIKESKWVVKGKMKYRILLGYENNPLLPENKKWATVEESWEYLDWNGKEQGYSENLYWGHYNMSERKAYDDYFKRLEKLN